MHKKLMLLAGLGIGLMSASVVNAVQEIPAPTAQLFIDSTSFDIPLAFDSTTGEFSLDTGASNCDMFGNCVFSSGGNRVTFSGEDAISGDNDPAATLALGVVDGGAASNFAVALSVPLLNPILGLAVWSDSVAGSWTDFGLAGGNGGAINTFLTPPGIDWFGVNGVLVTTLSIIGPAAVYPAGTTSAVYGPFFNSGVFNCAAIGGCFSFDLLLSFGGSGGGDAYSFTKGATIDAPEPPVAMLLGLGLLPLLWRHRGRRLG